MAISTQAPFNLPAVSLTPRVNFVYRINFGHSDDHAVAAIRFQAVVAPFFGRPLSKALRSGTFTAMEFKAHDARILTPTQRDGVLGALKRALPHQCISGAAAQERLKTQGGYILMLDSTVMLDDIERPNIFHVRRNATGNSEVFLVKEHGAPLPLDRLSSAFASAISTLCKGKPDVIADAKTLSTEITAAIAAIQAITINGTNDWAHALSEDLILGDIRIRMGRNAPGIWPEIGTIFEQQIEAVSSCRRSKGPAPIGEDVGQSQQAAQWALRVAVEFGPVAEGFLSSVASRGLDSSLMHDASRYLGRLGRHGMPTLIHNFTRHRNPFVISDAVSGLLETASLAPPDVCTPEEADIILTRIEALRSGDSPVGAFLGTQRMLVDAIGIIGRSTPEKAVKMLEHEFHKAIDSGESLSVNDIAFDLCCRLCFGFSKLGKFGRQWSVPALDRIIAKLPAELYLCKRAGWERDHILGSA